MKTLDRLIIAELVAIAAFAAKANIWDGVTSSNTVYTMADYSLPGNWNELEAPNGASATADFSTMTVGGVFVRIPTPSRWELPRAVMPTISARSS